LGKAERSKQGCAQNVTRKPPEEFPSHAQELLKRLMGGAQGNEGDG